MTASEEITFKPALAEMLTTYFHDAAAAVAVLQESWATGPIDWTVIDASGTLEETPRRAEAELSEGSSGHAA